MKPFALRALLSSLFFAFVRYFAGFSFYYFLPQTKAVRA